MNRTLAAGLTSVLALSAIAPSAWADPAPVTPEPAKALDVDSFFAGRWYEIARTPMKLTDGCVAGTTDYFKDAKGRLIDRDACRDGSPQGKEKVFAGPVTILNPPQSNKFEVRYKVFGLFHAGRTYWILDRSEEGAWFIVSDPQFKTLSLFTRAARPSQEAVDAIAARAKALGYDISKLEYPTQFPVGEGQAPPAAGLK
jgi:apolipoprotein D and lipocalin family protein